MSRIRHGYGVRACTWLTSLGTYARLSGHGGAALPQAGRHGLPGVLAAMPDGYRPLVVDDNSTDDTAEVARRHGAEVVAEPRPGYGSAVHAGVVAATTPIVAVLDADGSLDAGGCRQPGSLAAAGLHVRTSTPPASRGPYGTRPTFGGHSATLNYSDGDQTTVNVTPGHPEYRSYARLRRRRRA